MIIMSCGQRYVCFTQAIDLQAARQQLSRLLQH